MSFYPSASTGGNPDLWFRVTQDVPGHGTVTIYERFPVSCHTWWSHDCASEVALTTSHPLAYSNEDGDRVVERTVRTRKTTGARIGARGGPDLLPSIAYLKDAMRPSFALMA